MEIKLYGYETPRELLAVKAALDVLIATPYVEEPLVLVGKETDARVGVPDLPPVPAVEFTASDVVPGPPDSVMPNEPTKIVDIDPEFDPAAKPAPERDKHGRIWDERIDSSNMKQTTGGEWMKRKNVDDAVRQQVMAELSADNDAAPAEVFTAPVDASAPPPPPEAAGAAVPNGPDWGMVFARTVAAKSAEKLNDKQIDRWLTDQGIVGGFPALIARPDLYESFMHELGIA